MLSLVRSLCLIAFLFVAVSGSLAQTPGGASPANASAKDEAELRAVIEKFFELYAKEDLEGLMKLWSEKSPDYAERKKAMAELFVKEDYRFSNLTVTRLKVDGDKASLRASVEMTALNPQTKKERQENMLRNVQLVREADGWKMWRYAPAVNDLAKALVEAADEEARQALLVAESELVTPELVAAVRASGIAAANQGKFDQATLRYHLALTLGEKINDRQGIAALLNNIGMIHMVQGGYAQALDYVQRSLKLREELNDKAGSAASLNSIGYIYENQGNYSLALDYYQRGLKIREELNHRGGIAESLNNIGIIHSMRGSYALALDHYQRCLKFREELNDKAGIADSLLNIGIIYSDQGNYVLALEYYQRSLKLKEELNDKAGIASSLNNIGNIYSNQGNYALALDYYQRGLKIREELNDKARVATSLNNIGIIHDKQGSYELAIDYYQRSLKLKEEINDKMGIADSLSGMGDIYQSQGSYAKALDYSLRSLKIFEELNLKTRVASSLNNIGVIHESQGGYALALDYYQRSLKIKEEINDKGGIANSLGNIGNIHHRQANYALALDYYQRSQKLFEELNLKASIATSLNNIGLVHRNQDNHTQALDYYQRGLKFREELNDKGGIITSLINIGLIHQQKGNYALALEQAQKAAVLAHSIGAAEKLFHARFNEGRAHKALKNLPEARRAFAEAIAAAETLRTTSAGGDVGQQRLFESKTAPYLAMSDLLVSQNETAEALSFAERAKARTLLDALQSGRINIAKAMPAQEREQEDNLRAQLVSLNAQVFREKQRDKFDAERLKDLEAQRAKAQLAFDDFQTRLYASHPELKVQRGEAKPLSLPEAQALLPDDKTALLEYAVADDRTLLFVLSKAANAASTTPDLKVFSIPIKAKDLADRTEKFRRMLAGEDIGFKKEAMALYDLLFKPAQAALQGKSSLIIAPDGPLWELPFQALASGAKRYLIEDAAISYAPSLTYLREMSRKRASGQASAPRALLAIGDPALSQQTVARAQFATRGDEKLEPLPFAEKEAQEIANLYVTNQSKAYTGAEALEARFKAEAGDYRILHLATHGILNNSSPMYSQVLFSQSGNNEKEDGLLEAWEIMNLDLKADLVVLSACETARGRIGAGEGVIGLTWALFVAGVPATVVSQWKVMDASTQQLMVEFHRQLKTKPAQGKAESLRQAMLKVMKQPKTDHPYHWAPFVLVGAWR